MIDLAKGAQCSANLNKAVCAKFAHTAGDGKTYHTKFDNLDAIIAFGYRVNSIKAIQFRMNDWVEVTNEFLKYNRQNILEGAGKISRKVALKKVEKEYEIFRVRQDQEYISDFDKAIDKYRD